MEGVKIEFLKPRGMFILEDSSRPYPLAGKLSFGEVDFLFGEGIAQEGVQEKLIETYTNRIRSNVLYLPVIYGQAARNFVKKVSPRIVVINTVSKGYPRIRDVFRYNGSEGLKSNLFQTSTQGTVTILTDEREIKVRTFVDKNSGFLQ